MYACYNAVLNPTYVIYTTLTPICMHVIHVVLTPTYMLYIILTPICVTYYITISYVCVLYIWHSPMCMLYIW